MSARRTRPVSQPEKKRSRQEARRHRQRRTGGGGDEGGQTDRTHKMEHKHSVILPEELNERVQRAAALQGMKVGPFIRRLLQEKVGSYERGEETFGTVQDRRARAAGSESEEGAEVQIAGLAFGGNVARALEKAARAFNQKLPSVVQLIVSRHVAELLGEAEKQAQELDEALRSHESDND